MWQSLTNRESMCLANELHKSQKSQWARKREKPTNSTEIAYKSSSFERDVTVLHQTVFVILDVADVDVAHINYEVSMISSHKIIWNVLKTQIYTVKDFRRICVENEVFFLKLYKPSAWGKRRHFEMKSANFFFINLQ